MHSTITSKGQTTIPAELRDLLGVKPGDQIVYIPHANGEVTIRRKQRYKAKDLFGVLPKPKKALTVEQINKAIVDAVVKRRSHGLPRPTRRKP